MSNQSFTPGPWEVRYTEVHGRLYGLQGVFVAETDDHLVIEGSQGARTCTRMVCQFPGTTADDANARLISTAPELLAALELVLPMAKGYAAVHRLPINQNYIEVAEAIIARANGEL